MGCLNPDEATLVPSAVVTQWSPLPGILREGCSLGTKRTGRVSVPESWLHMAYPSECGSAQSCLGGGQCPHSYKQFDDWGVTMHQLGTERQSSVHSVSPHLPSSPGMLWDFSSLRNRVSSRPGPKRAGRKQTDPPRGSCLLPPAHATDAREWQLVPEGPRREGLWLWQCRDPEHALTMVPACFRFLLIFFLY